MMKALLETRALLAATGPGARNASDRLWSMAPQVSHCSLLQHGLRSRKRLALLGWTKVVIRCSGLALMRGSSGGKEAAAGSYRAQCNDYNGQTVGYSPCGAQLNDGWQAPTECLLGVMPQKTAHSESPQPVLHLHDSCVQTLHVPEGHLDSELL